MLKVLSLIILLFLLILFFPQKTFAANSLDVVISEIGWSGTVASPSDEWIELYNNTDSTIDLSGWGLYESGCTTPITTLIEDLTGSILSHEYYLIERTNDTTISDIPASQTPSAWGCSGLKNTGESLQLKDNSGTIIDTANSDGGAWPAGTDGSKAPNYASMERLNLTSSDTDSNWVTNDGTTRNGLAANESPINGTPKSKNSQGFVPTPSPTPTPTSTPSPTPSPTKTPTPKPSTPKPTTTPNPTPTPKATTVSISLGRELDSSESSKDILGTESSKPSIKPTNKPQVKTLGTTESNIPKILIGLGVIIIFSGAGIFLKSLKR